MTNSDLFTIEPAELKHETRHNYIDGPAIVVSNGTVIEDKSVPAFIRPRLAQLIDLKLGIVAKTKNPIQLLTDVIEYNAIPLDVTKLPHWSDRTSSQTLLMRLSCDVLMSATCVLGGVMQIPVTLLMTLRLMTLVKSQAILIVVFMPISRKYT